MRRIFKILIAFLIISVSFSRLLESEEEGEEKKEETLIEQRRKKLHRTTERSSTNARKVKQKLGYTCEVCGFNFKEKFGDISLNKKKEELWQGMIF